MWVNKNLCLQTNLKHRLELEQPLRERTQAALPVNSSSFSWGLSSSLKGPGFDAGGDSERWDAWVCWFRHLHMHHPVWASQTGLSGEFPFRTTSIPEIGIPIIQRLACQNENGSCPNYLLDGSSRSRSQSLWLEIIEWKSLMSRWYCLIGRHCWTLYLFNVWPFVGQVFTAIAGPRYEGLQKKEPFPWTRGKHNLVYNIVTHQKKENGYWQVGLSSYMKLIVVYGCTIDSWLQRIIIKSTRRYFYLFIYFLSFCLF